MTADLPDLAASAAGCQACDLHLKRRNVVFGEGSPQAPLVLVGEGPGEEEDRTGRPFVGRSGKMLDQALLENGLTRDHVYICNTVKCRACDWASGKPVNRPPTPEETAQCRRWLVPQLAAIAPQILLCIGAPSAKNLIRKDFKITVERGKIFKTEYAAAAIATLHPSYIMRNIRADSDGGFSLLVADIAKAWDTATRLAERQRQGSGHTQETLF